MRTPRVSGSCCPSTSPTCSIAALQRLDQSCAEQSAAADVNFGFHGTPLLGLPQGLSVFANGVRLNESFGDTVNWELLPVSAIHSVQLMAARIPVRPQLAGRRTVAALKDGFTFKGTQAESYLGSFGRFGGTLQHGGNNGTWGYYGNIDYFEEDGWRDFSGSDALRLHGALAYRGDGSTFDLALSHADSNLRGNGASPAELLQIDRSQVFTHPDITENRLTQIMASGSQDLAGGLTLSGNVFYRDLDTRTFNGDGTIFEECRFDDDEFLVEEDFDDVNADGECDSDDDVGIQLVFDPNGDPIEAEIDDEELNAINNIGRRKQRAMWLDPARAQPRSRRRPPQRLHHRRRLLARQDPFNSVTEVAALRRTARPRARHLR